MNKKQFGEMLGSLDEAVEIARGNRKPARAYTLSDPDVRAIRRSLGLTQVEFAALLDVPVATIQGYEQGRRAPDAPARTLLRVALAAPELLRSIQTESKIAETSDSQGRSRAGVNVGAHRSRP
ncbi:MAG TPA: NadS family protein [Thermoanaerobaculia bacterium]|nr:NadS family protein [Thermoanaerobaculia bacterium]